MTVTDVRNVVTQHNDIQRTGAYLHETRLTPDSVKGPHFGRLFERNVNGSPFAQILYVRNVPLTKQGTEAKKEKVKFKNLFFVATSTNWVYAFDADDHAADPKTPPVWQVNLGPTRSLNEAEICRETWGTVGITSTPVIDVDAQTMYVVAIHWPSSTDPTPAGQKNLNGEHYLHALKLSDGKDVVDPVKIGDLADGHDPRTGRNFKPSVQRNRPGLLLLNGVVYIAFATFSCDAGGYHGWVFGYDAKTLKRVGIFCTSAPSIANERGSGIWQSGNGLVGSDEGCIYFETGNDFGDKVAKYGNSFVRLRVIPGGAGLVDETGPFQPSNELVLRNGDTDLGSGGPVLLPGDRLIGGGKQGRYYVLDTHSMKLTQDQVSLDADKVGEGFQAFQNTYRDVAKDEADLFRIYAQGEAYGPNIHGGPCYWPGPSLLYQMPEKDYLKAFFYDVPSGTVKQDPVAKAAVRPPNGMPGGHSSLSANGGKDGIVWTSFPTRDSAQYSTPPGTLVAFNAKPNATNQLEELWRDPDPGERAGRARLHPEWFAKFNPPTIADGKVFRPCFERYHEDLKDPSAPTPKTLIADGKVVVYGLRPQREPKPKPLPKPQRLWEYLIGLIADQPGRIIGPGGVKPGPPPASAIDAKWRSHGGGILAAPAGDEHTLRDGRGGRRRDFVGAITTPVQRVSIRDLPPGGSCHHPPTESVAVASSIFWSPDTGAHIVTGEIRDDYLARGGPTGELGYPLSDEIDTVDGLGRVSHFENGYIIWTPHHGPTVRLLR